MGDPAEAGEAAEDRGEDTVTDRVKPKIEAGYMNKLEQDIIAAVDKWVTVLLKQITDKFPVSLEDARELVRDSADQVMQGGHQP